jgi:hypothetical protein
MTDDATRDTTPDAHPSLPEPDPWHLRDNATRPNKAWLRSRRSADWAGRAGSAYGFP